MAKHFPLPSLGGTCRPAPVTTLISSVTPTSSAFLPCTICTQQATLIQAQSLALHTKKPNICQTSNSGELAGGGQTPAGQAHCHDFTRATGPAEPQGVLTSVSTGKPCCKPRQWHSSHTPTQPPDKQQLYLVQELNFHLFSSPAENAFKLHIFHQLHISPHNFSINFPRILAPFSRTCLANGVRQTAGNITLFPSTSIFTDVLCAEQCWSHHTQLPDSLGDTQPPPCATSGIGKTSQRSETHYPIFFPSKPALTCSLQRGAGWEPPSRRDKLWLCSGWREETSHMSSTSISALVHLNVHSQAAWSNKCFSPAHKWKHTTTPNKHGERNLQLPALQSAKLSSSSRRSWQLLLIAGTNSPLIGNTRDTWEESKPIL